MQKQRVNILIGRFQPLHRGHAAILQKITSSNNLSIILIGSADTARTVKNPLTFSERKQFIETYLSANVVLPNRYVILPLQDHPNNDAKWIQAVQESVDTGISFLQTKNGNFTPDLFLTGTHRDSSTLYLSAFPQFKLDLCEAISGKAYANLSATQIRESMFSPVLDDILWGDVPPVCRGALRKFIQTKEFESLKEEFAYIKKYKDAWAAAPYPFNNVCTDAVVIQSGHVLLIKRGALPGRGLWALPGGHVDQGERLVDACIRELVEETGIKVPAKVLKASIKAQTCFDAPDRSLLGRCYSHTFLIRLDDTLPLPKVKGQNAPLDETGGVVEVETLKARWIPLNTALSMPEKYFDDHYHIISWALDNIKD